EPTKSAQFMQKTLDDNDSLVAQRILPDLDLCEMPSQSTTIHGERPDGKIAPANPDENAWIRGERPEGKIVPINPCIELPPPCPPRAHPLPRGPSPVDPGLAPRPDIPGGDFPLPRGAFPGDPGFAPRPDVPGGDLLLPGGDFPGDNPGFAPLLEATQF